MSAKRRPRSSKNSQLNLQYEMSIRSDSPGSRISSASSKKSTWLENVDDNEFILKQQTSSRVNVEPENLQSAQTVASRPLSYIKRPKPIAFWKRFLRGLRGFWKTRYSEDLADQEAVVKTTLRELALYLIFVIIMCIITFGMTSSTMFYFTNVMKGIFTGEKPAFEEVGSMDDFFTYLTNTVLSGLYTETYYDDTPVRDDEIGYIYFENKILGRARLRQVRVRNDSCIVHEYFQKDIKECFAPYTSESEFVGKFGLANGSAWEFSSEEELNGKSMTGMISTYGGGGYTVLLGANSEESNQIVTDLKSNRWLDRGTRAVFIDFAVYNANINLFGVISLLFEFPATGGCITFSSYQTLKLLRYVTTMDHFVMACEGIFIVMLIYYFIEEAIEIKKHGSSYFSDVWNIFDIIVVVMGFTCIIFNIYRTVIVTKRLRDLLDQQDQYANFESLAYWQSKFNDFVAVTVFIVWIKIFKYVSFNKTMTQLQSTLSRCSKDIAGFSVMFFIVFCAFAQWGYLLLGTQVEDYSTYLNCIFSLFRLILGDFSFGDIVGASRYMGPIFFVLYIFFVFFLLINMFLAIINDTYAEVKSDLAEQKDEFQVGDYFKSGYDKMMSKLSFKREKIVDLQKALQSADANNDNKVDFEEWRAELKLRGHADAEIEAVFAQYDIDGDRILNELEQQKMHDDLEAKKNEIVEELEEVKKAKSEVKSTLSRLNVKSGDGDDGDDEESDSGSECSSQQEQVGHEEFSILARRVDRVEQSIGSMVSKIESVLLKLETMDKAKIKRRETMTKLLDSIAEQELSGFAERINLNVTGKKTEVDISRPSTAVSRQTNDSTVSVKEEGDDD